MTLYIYIYIYICLCVCVLFGTLMWFYEAYEYFHTYISLVNCIRPLLGSNPGACHPNIERSELGI